MNTYKNISEIKSENQKRSDQLFKDCDVFFAFSNSQFNESKTPLQEGEKYVSIGGGGYLPKSKYAALDAGIDDIEKWYKNELKKNKARKANIAYELANHEAYYTGCINSTLDALGNDYTIEEVREVYRKELKNNVQY